MRNKTLKAVVERANALKQIAETNLDGIPQNVLAGFRAKIVSAKQELEKIKDDFADTLSPHVALVYVDGDFSKQEALKTLLRSQNERVVDADFYYNKMATELNNFMGRHRKFTLDTYVKLTDIFKDIAKEMEIRNGGKLNLPVNLVNKEMPEPSDVKEAVSHVISKSLGIDVIRRSIILLSVKEVIAAGVNENVPVIFVFGVPTELIVSVGRETFSGNFITCCVKSDEVVDRKFVDGVKKSAKKHFDKISKLGE